MRKTTTFGAAVIALAASGWIATAAAQAPAPADPAPATPPTTDAAPPAATPDATTKPAKPMHHKKMMSSKMGTMGKGKLKGTVKGDEAVDDLNAKSLDAAKSGKSFAPPTTPISEPAAHEKGGKMMKPAHSMKMKHHMAKKAMEAKPDASAPAPDASAPAPDAPAPK